MSSLGERQQLADWWEHYRRSGALPAELSEVQSRLIRSVHRGELPRGAVFVKTMTFPRRKDRLRYLVRALPAQHEAAMLGRVAAAGIPCPEVVDVRAARRFGLPHRSWLVTRALPVPLAGEPPSLAEQAEVALRLLRAGIVHRDLHADNFVRLQDGSVAVLDLQSASAGKAADDAVHRLAAAARLVRDHPTSRVAAAVEGGLITSAEAEAVLERAARERTAFWRRRVMRCLGETTEFTRRVRWSGIEHRHRTVAPPGYWHRQGRGVELRDAWIGQRVHAMFGSRSPVFWAFFRKWWWLGGGGALYVPQTCREERFERELAIARSGVAELDGHLQQMQLRQQAGSGTDGDSRQPDE
ncbi:MAG: phosphotransferase [bacterium]|nr:phosphotransferase [bacterium]